MQQTSEQTFARRVRELREQREWSQTLLAANLALSHGIKLDGTAITRIEKGARSIRLDEAVALAKVFGMTVDEMLRPALPVDEQIKQAERQVERSQWRAAEALGEHSAAEARLARLQKLGVDEQAG